MTSEGRGILSPVRLIAPGLKALQALDFLYPEPLPELHASQTGSILVHSMRRRRVSFCP